MSRRHLALSLFLIWHLAAVIVAVIPEGHSVRSPAPSHPNPDDPLAVRLAPVFDRLAATADAITTSVEPLVRPLRALTMPYLNALGFDQRWVMFASPPKLDQYVRVRYFVAESAADAIRAKTELVFPAYPEYEVRGFQSFRASYQDRAVNTMIERYHQNPGGENPYVPLASFVSRRAATQLRPGERLERIEIWHGVVPNPPPGTGAETPASRVNLLRDYYSGLADALGPVTPTPLSGTEREADIGWTVEFVQTR